MKKLTIILMLFSMTISFSTLLFADESKDLKKHPGYVNFEEIEIPGNAEETVEVYISGPILRLVAKVTEQEDPKLSAILENLLLIKVNTFSTDRNLAQTLKQKIKKIESDLTKQKWEKIVKVKDRDEYVNVYLKLGNNEKIVGLVVMAVDNDDEAVFVNIVGETDWESISKIGRKFDIDYLEDIK